MKVFPHGMAALTLLAVVSLAAPASAQKDSPSDREEKPAVKKQEKDKSDGRADGKQAKRKRGKEDRAGGKARGGGEARRGGRGRTMHRGPGGSRFGRFARGMAQRGGPPGGRHGWPGGPQFGFGHPGMPRHAGSAGGHRELEQRLDALEQKLDMVIRLLHQSRQEDQSRGRPQPIGPGGERRWPPEGGGPGNPGGIGPGSGGLGHGPGTSGFGPALGSRRGEDGDRRPPGET